MQRVMKTVYECIMALLVMVTIITIWTENTYNSTINWIVWFVFFVDFFIRLLKSEKKWDFIKGNPFLIIAIIPFDQFFQMARVVRIIYLFRIKTITKYYITPLVRKLTYKSMTLIVSICLVIFIVESIVIWKLEGITTYYDALLVLFSHLLFFGHRMYTIEAPVAIWLLTGTSIIGVVIQGLALQWLFAKLEVLYTKGIRKSDRNVDNKIG